MTIKVFIRFQISQRSIKRWGFLLVNLLVSTMSRQTASHAVPTPTPVQTCLCPGHSDVEKGHGPVQINIFVIEGDYIVISD